ncbi:transcriptional regulator [Streptomyces sp. SID5468]|nr:transcriptional regulator [Streptomyces sp. SID5468]
MRHAAATTKENVRHAAELVAPYAGTAKDTAAHYADEARRRIAPKVSSAADQARTAALAQYGCHVVPRIAQARHAVPPKLAASVDAAAKRTRETARQAADYTAPRVGQAVEAARSAAEPVREEALARGAAALAALRGQVPAAELDKLLRRGRRRARTGRAVKCVLCAGLVAGAGVAAWRWWRRQTNPEWLVEAPSPTEVVSTDSHDAAGSARPPLTAVDGSGDSLDPEVRAKQAEADEEKPEDEF